MTFHLAGTAVLAVGAAPPDGGFGGGGCGGFCAVRGAASANAARAVSLCIRDGMRFWGGSETID